MHAATRLHRFRLAWLALALPLASCREDPIEVPGPGNSGPIRLWSFWEYPANGFDRRPGRVFERQTGGVVADEYQYGLLPFRINGDSTAMGRVFSSATGEVYWVFAAAPAATIPTRSNSTAGNVVELRQRQSFRKTAENASLTLTITAAWLQAINSQRVGAPNPRCDANPMLCELILQAAVDFEVVAHDTPNGLLYWGHSSADVWFPTSGAGQFHVHQHGAAAPIWRYDDFNWDYLITPAGSEQGQAHLTRAVVIPVNLSRVRVGQEFTLSIIASAETYNLLGGESYLGAYFRDPANLTGATMRFTGLRPTNDPLPTPDLDGVGAAPACTGANPGAGVLRFTDPEFTVHELPVRGPHRVTVARTGGGAGHVSAVVRTSNGSAAAGADYATTSTVVAWGPGDTLPRTVDVKMVLDSLAEPDETVNLTLADARGCATLGASSAVLQIVDDDRPDEPPPTFTVGGEVSGLAGSGLVLREVVTGEDIAPAASGPFTFGRPHLAGFRYDVRVVTQPSRPDQSCTVANGAGTIVGANVTDVRVTCQTIATPSGLDTQFGSGGKSATQRGEGEAVLVQPDGRIVVAGHGVSSTTTDFLVRRYNADGSLDGTFGSGGTAAANFAGNRIDEAFDIARQADGKLVVVGRTQRPAPTAGFDFGIARFNTDGTLDAGFGTGGLVVTRAGDGGAAQGVAIQPDGKIVVAGHANLTSTTSNQGNDFAVARYNPDGTPDAGFSGDGIVITDFGGGSSSEAHGVVVQPDGRIVLAGHAGAGSGSFNFALARYNADGSLDAAFGGGGTVSLDLSSADDLGRALVLDASGRLVVIGSSGSGPGFDLMLARYTPTGALDATFGSGGKLRIDFFGAADGGQGVALQPDGRIVGAGEARNGTTVNVAVVRVLP